MIVVLSPGFDLFSGIFERHEPVGVEALIPDTSVEGFDEGVIGRLVDFPGREKSSVTPLSYAHLSSASEMNSGPLSACIRIGCSSRWLQTFESTRTTSSPVSDCPTSMARHSRVKLSTTVSARNFLPSNNASETKSMLQLWFGAVSSMRSIRLAAAFLRRGRLVRRLRPSAL